MYGTNSVTGCLLNQRLLNTPKCPFNDFSRTSFPVATCAAAIRNPGSRSACMRAAKTSI